MSCSAALKVAGQVKTELLKEASGLLEVDESELDLKDQRVTAFPGLIRLPPWQR